MILEKDPLLGESSEEELYTAAELAERNKGQNSGKGKNDHLCCVYMTLCFVLLLGAGFIVTLVLIYTVGLKIPVVDTACGPVTGELHIMHNVFIFKGIPYAEPPIGNLRWKAPIPINESAGNCWENDLQAKTYGRQCPQIEPYNKSYTGSEDCLYLNIYTPSIIEGTDLPVMVFIHGGHLMHFNASMEGYSPNEALTGKLDVVFVSIQYRLNALGFLVVGPLLNRTGNYGLLDQIAALQWIKENIRGFGGDPKKVTVFGHGAGGTSVLALMSSPLAKNLFERAWVLSGSAKIEKTKKQAAAINREFLTETGCRNISCLYNLSAENIVRIAHKTWLLNQSTDIPTKGQYEMPLLVVDGKVIPKSPYELWNKTDKRIPDVPILIGATAQAIDYSPAPGKALRSWTKVDYHKYVNHRLNSFGKPNITSTSLDLYPFGKDNAEQVFTTMASDIRHTCVNQETANRMAKGITSPVYQYIVTNIPANPVNFLGFSFPAAYAFSGWDLLGFFRTMQLWMQGDPDFSNLMFSQHLQRNVFYFILHGKPKDRSWKSTPGNIAVFDESLAVVPEYHAKMCKFWKDNGFFNYSWVN